MFFLKKRAFTLLEILLSVSIFTLTLSVLSPVYLSTKNQDDLDTKNYVIVSSLRRAKILSISGQNDSSWGLKIFPEQIVIFQGDSYNTRNSTFDDIIEVNNSIEMEGLDEIVFSKIFGETSNTGEIKLKLNNREKNININKKGIVTF